MISVRPFVLGLCLATLASAADVTPIVAPPKRTASLERAKQMLAAKTPDVPAELPDPFTANAVTPGDAGVAPGSSATVNPTPGAPAPRPVGPRSPRDLMVAISDALRPSGMVVLRGEPTLLFGQKRVKAGEKLTITFEGTEHTLDITSIAPPNFTFRLNQEEFTRPIK